MCIHTCRQIVVNGGEFTCTLSLYFSDVVLSVLKRPLSLLGRMNDLMKAEGGKASTDTPPSQPNHTPSDHVTIDGIKGVAVGGDEGVADTGAVGLPEVRSVLHSVTRSTKLGRVIGWVSIQV